ncbi:TfoX/Sxy family protein [Chitinimonas sp.]|uniref:TfoX/Sxy family protein n=1 Tax=Chitinimonas sp. TaxID=1934313 RepID=UPI002F944C92
MRRSEFVDWLCEQLAPMGFVNGRAMFGGWGIYCDGLMFAIVIDEVLYLKTDAETRPQHEAAGCGPFEYQQKDGRVMQLSYYRIPDEALEERLDLLAWSRAALGVALRAQAAKPARKPRKPAPP